MKLNIVATLALLAVVVQQGESSVTRQVVTEVLETINTLSGTLVNDANDYFLEKLQNKTQIKEWSVKIQVSVVTGLTKAAFSVFDFLNNASLIDVKLFDCIAEQETSLLAAISQASSDNGWCNNNLAANLTYAFQGVTELMVERNTEFKTYLDSLSSCLLGDDLCFTQYAAKIAAYVASEFGTEGDTMLTAVEQVIAIYKIMFGQDVPACAKEYFFPEIADGIHNASVNVYKCVSS